LRRRLVLFTCDLRVHDNAALAAAASGGAQVIPLFVLDEELLAGSCGSPNRIAFLLGCLRDLDGALGERGAGLVVRRGDPVTEAIRLAKRFEASSIDISEDVTPYAAKRREGLAKACRQQRIELHGHPGPSVLSPGAIVPAKGDHYRVFTPYSRRWAAQHLAPAAPTPRRLHAPSGLPAMRLPSARSLVRGAGRAPSPRLLPGGERSARERLARWLRDGLGGYGERHDDLAGECTSRLSAYLHFGCISPRTVLEQARTREGGEEFARQLCWRDFHRQVLAARPDLPHADYRGRGDRWRRSRRDLEAWREGLTGYPIVDAGMRQLAAEGFMHNRARLIAGSFLTKTLYIDWRRGAAHFATLLQDADLASNVGNWQWVAGTGNDTRPNRVLNPLRQARRFDPDGDYVRRHLPELAHIAGRAVHEPWRLPPAERRALRYPHPAVDLDAAAQELRARRAR
jgi:deoxyribodipyrimidine photo-lyase